MKNNRIIDKGFYKVDAITLAKALLGCYLCRHINDKIIKEKITETEAYIANIDSACHAYKGKTNKNKALFEEGGHAYIHICYGIHFMLNIVSGDKDDAQGILIRSTENAKGPGNVTKKLFIDKELYLEDLTCSNKLWIEDKKYISYCKETKRIGLGQCNEEDKNRLWRFVMLN